jgi:hypothetical protein
MWRNGSGRLTLQASPKNKFNFFWDEQDTCQDPCDGVVAVFTSPESWFSVATHPNRLRQIGWTNPLTSRLLVEAGLSVTTQFYDTTHHRYLTNPQSIPRVLEVGATAGYDDSGVPTNATVTNGFTQLSSGSLNGGIGAFGSPESRDLGNYRSRASLSYVTGRHHAKIGYEGGYFLQDTRNQVNDPRISYQYNTPAANCALTLSCGNTSLYYPNDPNNFARRPVPTQLTINTGPAVLYDRAMFAAFYAQDQWTLKRFTFSGALRYDHATSHYLGTCVGPDRFVPLQSNGQNSYCTPPSDGVSYHDLTPRWGATWDVFGNGKTAIKWNMGKYLAAAGLNDIYTNANLARRTVNSLTRTWTDTNGNRIPDCILLNFAANGECGAPTFGQDSLRFGRDPAGLDSSGIPLGLNTTQCGRTEAAIPAAVRAYCNSYGGSLISGWGKRRYEWQFGLGIQREILPRLSVEVTYNRRKYGNQMVTDTLGLGCDLYNGADAQTCLQNQLNYSSPQYDFFTVTAPVDPRLPGGGGYVIRGNGNPKLTTVTTGLPQAQILMDALDYSWNGVDTNFVWRGPHNIRLNGGTSTGRSVRDTCLTELDSPNVKGRVGDNFAGGCRPYRPYQTRVNGTASYFVPKVDVLVSTVFQYQPGVEMSANVTYTKDQVTWDTASASRATAPCPAPTVGTGCFVASGFTTTATTSQVNLLDFGDMYTDGVSLFDVKLSKALHFGRTRLNAGVDIYNLFNSSAVTAINTTYSLTGTNNWGLPTTLVNPRFFRLSVQYEF